jgi:ATP phosphoribosyltransferase
MTRELRIALPKGRLLEQAVELLSKAGIHAAEEYNNSRRLMQSDSNDEYALIALKPIDIPVYVESGAVDLGIVGSDILRELEPDLYEPLDLQIGKCTLSLAARAGRQLSYEEHLRIATKYPRTADRFFKARRAHVQVVRLEGSVEIAPLLGLADAIVDLVETGRTLRENGLAVVEEIAPVSARLIVNRTAMKIHSARINQLVAQLDAVIYANP